MPGAVACALPGLWSRKEHSYAIPIYCKPVLIDWGLSRIPTNSDNYRSAVCGHSVPICVTLKSVEITEPAGDDMASTHIIVLPRIIGEVTVFLNRSYI